MYKVINEINEIDLNFFLNKIYNSNNQYNLWTKTNKSNILKEIFCNLKFEDKNTFNIILYKNEIVVTFIKISLSIWDSNHFGFVCATLNSFFIDKEIISKDIDNFIEIIEKEIKDYYTKNNVSFVFANIDSLNSELNYIIQKLNFKFILNWSDGIISPDKINYQIQDNFTISDKIDEKEVLFFSELASNNYFKGGRFYQDLFFDKSKVNKMYSDLVLNSFKNKDILLVLKKEEIPIGLFICKKITEYQNFENLKVAHLRFLLVDSFQREKGIGKYLFESIINYLYDKCDLVTTGLETHNYPSLNLHSKIGFKFNYSHNVYHCWVNIQ
jgi:hypothetical protein